MAGTRDTETTGTMDTVTKAMATVDTAAITTTTTLLVVTMDMVPDMITVSTQSFSFWLRGFYTVIRDAPSQFPSDT